MKSLSGLNNDQADSADPDGLNDELTKLVITKPRQKIPDCIATDDEDLEPPAWHAWDEWDQKVNAQEDWTWHNTLKYKAKKGGRSRGLDLAQHTQVQGQERTLKRISYTVSHRLQHCLSQFRFVLRGSKCFLQLFDILER